MTLLGLAVRSHRTGIIALSLLGILTGLLNAVGYAQVAGVTPAERQAFAHQMEALGQQLSYLLPSPVQLDTMGGYLTWRSFGTIGLLFALWGALAATGLGRGDEERGLTEHWIATGVSRTRWLVTRAVGFALASLVTLALGIGLTTLGAALVNDALPLGPVLLELVLLWGLTLSAFGLGLVLAQLVITRRGAGSLAAVTVVALFVLNSAGRSGLDAGALRLVSPFYLFERSAPLLRDAPFDLGATIALFAVGAALTAAGIAAFSRRDIGGSLLRLRSDRTRRTTRPSPDPLLRLPVLAMVDQQRWWIVGWSIGLAALAYVMTSIARSIVDNLSAIPTMRVYFERLGVAAYSDFIGVLWFGSELFILSALVIAQVNSWAADDAEGRLETMLAAGASRARVVVERIAALLVVCGVVASVSSLVVFLAAGTFGIGVSGDRMTLATVLTLPVVFAFAAIGHALVGWRPRAAVIALAAVAVLSYFIQQFAPIFDLPQWLGRLSIYSLYGTPMSKDDWGGIASLVAVGLAGTAIALASMRRRDVGA